MANDLLVNVVDYAWAKFLTDFQNISPGHLLTYKYSHFEMTVPLHYVHP